MATAVLPRLTAPRRRALWQRRRRSAITFDLGASSLSACQLQANGINVAILDRLRLERLTAGPVLSEGEEAANPAFVTALRRAVMQGNFEGDDIAILVPMPDVQFHAMRLPDNLLALPRERIDEALAWEVARETRDEAGKLEVRYWRLPLSTAANAPNVMTVAMQSDCAMAYVRAAQQAGLTLRRLEPAPTALARVAAQVWPVGAQDLWGLLDLGERLITLTIAHGATPVYVRVLESGLGMWRLRMASALEVDEATAGQMLRAEGLRLEKEIPAAQPLAASAVMDDLAAMAGAVLRDTLTQLARDAEMCLRYALQSYPQSSVVRIVLAGGGALAPGLREVLESLFDLPVMMLSCRDERLVELNPRDAAVIGAALLDLEGQ